MTGRAELAAVERAIAKTTAKLRALKAKRKAMKAREQLAIQRADPVFMQRMSEAASARQKARWQDPAYRKRMSAVASERAKRYWADPKNGRRMTKHVAMMVRERERKREEDMRRLAEMDPVDVFGVLLARTGRRFDVRT